jgi:hypothetical protein
LGEKNNAPEAPENHGKWEEMKQPLLNRIKQCYEISGKERRSGRLKEKREPLMIFETPIH